VTGLAEGRYLALTPAELKALRACKGDRARREHIAASGAPRLDVGDAWFFLRYLGGDEVALGKRLHRGQMHRIELLDREKVAAALATLVELRAAFFAIDETKFRYKHVAFWVAEQWQREGRTTLLDETVFARVAAARDALVRFLADTAGRELVFTASY